MTQVEFCEKIDALYERTMDLSDELYALRYQSAGPATAADLAQIGRRTGAAAISIVALAESLLQEEKG